jgi:2-polyprenyl-6-methoxyphenol hydroxylase-like FAD-dependent oxidoreductase
MQAGTSLDVIAVGAGVCGLSCAIGLRRASHHVTVLDRYTADDTTGARIALKSNATRLLRQWGLDLKSVGASWYQKGLIIDGKTLQVKLQLHLETVEPVDPVVTTRPDLINLLRAEVERRLRPDEGEGNITIIYPRRWWATMPRHPPSFLWMAHVSRQI